jgi:hypothetical protein
MSFAAAALALAWIAIALLGFGFAALLQQVRGLQAAMRLPPAARAGALESARVLAPTSSDRRFVLTVDPGCGFCHEVYHKNKTTGVVGYSSDFYINVASGTIPHC